MKRRREMKGQEKGMLTSGKEKDDDEEDEDEKD